MIYKLFFIILLSISYNTYANEVIDRYSIINILKQELTAKIDYQDHELTNAEFKQYYLAEVRPFLNQLILESRIEAVDIDQDGNDELIIWSDGIGPSAWRPKDFIAIAKKFNSSWKIELFEYLQNDISPSIQCTQIKKCNFSYSRFIKFPKSPNQFIGAILTYAAYGGSGHTFTIKTLGWNKYNSKLYIQTILSPIPLIPDSTWK